MVRLTKAQREWRPGMPKKRRSTKVMFASLVLMMEAFIAFFATLVIFGLRKDLDAGLVLGFGLGLSLVLVLSCAVVRKPWGVALGWVLQPVMIALGFLEPMMFVIGSLLALSWWYAIVTGTRIDRENAQRDREQAAWEDSQRADGPSSPGLPEGSPGTSGTQ